MLRTLPILVSLLFLWASVAWGANEDCTIAASAQDWGDITTLSPTANCSDKAAPPDNDDIVKVPDGAIVDVIADVAFGADGSGIEVLSGGTLSADVTAVGDAIVITLFDGQDTNPGALGQVALWGEAGSTITLQGGYLERNVDATPTLVETVSEDKGNIWTVDLATTCDPGDENTVGGELGGQEDCADGDEEKLFTLAYTDTRNNPEQTNADNFLEESVTAIATDYLVYFITGMDAGHVYSIESVDSTAATYNITLDVHQIPAGYTNDAFPLAMRNQVLLTTEDAGQKGDTCIESDGSVIAADGDLVGACAYFYDAAGDNGWSRPLRITKVLNAEDCTGAGGNDAFYFAAESPLLADIPDAAQVVISPTCIARGDKFAVLAPVILSCEASRADGECKMVFEGDVTLHGVLIDGSGQVLFDGANADIDTLHVRSAGEDGVAAIKFTTMTNVDMSCSSVVGGPKADDGNGIEFADISGHTILTDVATRYIGGDNFYTSGSAMGTAKFERISCERIGYVGVASGDGCLDAAAKWSRIGIVDLFFADASVGENGSVLTTGNTPATVNGIAIYGQTEGGLSKKNSSYNMEVYSLFGRGIVGSRSLSTGSWADKFISHCDIDDMTLETGTALDFMSDVGNTLENCLIKNYTGDTTFMLEVIDSAGTVSIRNNIFYNTTTTAAGNGNDLINWTLDDDDTTVSTVEDNSFLWDDGETTLWTTIVQTDSTTGDALNFGGNLIDGFNNTSATADAAAIGFDLHADAADDAVQRVGRNNCVGYATVSGAGSPSITYVADADHYASEPILGIASDYDAINLGKGALRVGSYLAEKKCGARTGPNQPGMGPGHDWLYERMGVQKPSRTLITQKPKAF